MEGWIALHRSLALHDLWLKEPFTRGQAWVDLLILANHKPGWIMVRGIQIDIDRGQVGWSILKLSNRWKWSQGKVNRFLNSLEKMHQIRVSKVIQNRTKTREQTGEQKSGVTSLITIVNYDIYQKSENRTKSKRRTDEEQTETNNNDNNKNKELMRKFDEFWQSYPKKKAKEKSKDNWKKLNPNTELFDKIMGALKEHAKSTDWQKEGGKYIPYPAVWLNGRRWEDEIEPEHNQGGSELQFVAGMRIF